MISSFLIYIIFRAAAFSFSSFRAQTQTAVDRENFAGKGLIAINIADQGGHFFRFDQAPDGNLSDNILQRFLIHPLYHGRADVARRHRHATNLSHP